MDSARIEFEAFLPDFLTEAEEHLSAVDDLCLQAEQNAGTLSPEGLDGLFRAVHTLKGMAGMMGLTVFAELAHHMEQPLEALRAGTRAFESADWHALGEGLQALRQIHACLAEHGQETPPEQEDAGGAKTTAQQSVRVDTARLDHLLEIVGEMIVHLTRLNRLSSELGELAGAPAWETRRPEAITLATQLSDVMQAVKRVSDDLQASTIRVRMLPIAKLFARFPRVVRDVAVACGKQARLVIEGGDTELDKTVIEQIGDPLMHLVRNAIDHGLEAPEARRKAGKPPTGQIVLSASQQGPSIVICVADDGRGIDRERVLAKARALGWFAEDAAPGEHELLQVIFRPGFTTTEQVTAISGRGVGMDVVHQNIQQLGGTIQIASTPGLGTRFTIKLPLTLVSAKALLARAGAHTIAIPLAAVAETLRLGPEHCKLVHGAEMLALRDQLWPIMRLDQWAGAEAGAGSAVGWPAVVIGDGEHHLALLVDELLGQQDVVMKSLGDFLGAPPGVGGATILGDGRVALILDAASLLGLARAQGVA